jgi:hypothetical protein
MAALNDFIANATPMTEARRLALRPSAADEGMRVTQQLARNIALLRAEDAAESGAVIMLRGLKFEPYVGTSLAALFAKQNAAYIQVVGVQTYKTVLGASAQAWVLEMVYQQKAK